MNEDYFLFTKLVHRIFAEPEWEADKRFLLEWATAAWFIRISGNKGTCPSRISSDILEGSVLFDILSILQARFASLPAPEELGKQFDYGKERKKRQQALDDVAFLLASCEAFYREHEILKPSSGSDGNSESQTNGIDNTAKDLALSASLRGEATSQIDTCMHQVLMDDF